MNLSDVWTTQRRLSDALAEQANYFDQLFHEWGHEHHDTKAARINVMRKYIEKLPGTDRRFNVLEDLGEFENDVVTFGTATVNGFFLYLHRGREAPSSAMFDHLVSCFVQDLITSVDTGDAYDDLHDEGRSALWRLCAARVVRSTCDDLEAELVAMARSRGASWTTIGEVLGRTRQALQQRYRDSAN